MHPRMRPPVCIPASVTRFASQDLPPGLHPRMRRLAAFARLAAGGDGAPQLLPARDDRPLEHQPAGGRRSAARLGRQRCRAVERDRAGALHGSSAAVGGVRDADLERAGEARAAVPAVALRARAAGVARPAGVQRRRQPGAGGAREARRAAAGRPGVDLRGARVQLGAHAAVGGSCIALRTRPAHAGAAAAAGVGAVLQRVATAVGNSTSGRQLAAGGAAAAVAGGAGGADEGGVGE